MTLPAHIQTRSAKSSLGQRRRRARRRAGHEATGLYRRVLVCGSVRPDALVHGCGGRESVVKDVRRSLSGAVTEGVETLTITVAPDPTAADVSKIRKMQLWTCPGGGPSRRLDGRHAVARVASQRPLQIARPGAGEAGLLERDEQAGYRDGRADRTPEMAAASEKQPRSRRSTRRGESVSLIFRGATARAVSGGGGGGGGGGEGGGGWGEGGRGLGGGGGRGICRHGGDWTRPVIACSRMSRCRGRADVDYKLIESGTGRMLLSHRISPQVVVRSRGGEKIESCPRRTRCWRASSTRRPRAC